MAMSNWSKTMSLQSKELRKKEVAVEQQQALNLTLTEGNLFDRRRTPFLLYPPSASALQLAGRFPDAPSILDVRIKLRSRHTLVDLTLDHFGC